MRSSNIKPEAIIRARQRLFMTQARFAAHIGVHPMTVSKWERGKATPRPEMSDRRVREVIREAYLVEQRMKA
jgi:DNA-binding transcriptional regulator YiaG